MYNIKENLIFGFHGCDETLCDELSVVKKFH